MIITEPQRPTTSIDNMDASLHSIQQELIRKVVPVIVQILKETISKDLLLADSTVGSKQITVD